MATSTPSTIWIKGEGLVKEGKANGAITPGYLCTRTNVANEFKKHDVVGVKPGCAVFALEMDFVGKGIDDNIPTTDRGTFLYPQRGAEIYAKLPANAPAIVVGDFLESNGDGTLRKVIPLVNNTGGTADRTLQSVGAAYAQAEEQNNFSDLFKFANDGNPTALCRALEAVDNSAVGAEARIRVEVL